jgi:toxin ParE1/3/4
VAQPLIVRFARPAVADVEAARDYYEAIRDDLAVEFRDELEVVLERLTTFPLSGRPVAEIRGVRRARLRRFPFSIFYSVTSEAIEVVRVLHGARQVALADDPLPDDSP